MTVFTTIFLFIEKNNDVAGFGIFVRQSAGIGTVKLEPTYENLDGHELVMEGTSR